MGEYIGIFILKKIYVNSQNDQITLSPLNGSNILLWNWPIVIKNKRK